MAAGRACSLPRQEARYPAHAPASSVSGYAVVLRPCGAGWGCVWCCATVLSCCCSPPVLDGDACGAVPLCCRVIAALQCQAPTFAPIAHLLPHKTLPEPPKVVLGARVVRHFLGGGLQGPAHCRQEGWPLRPVRRRDQQLRVQVGSACLRDKGKGLRATPTAVRKWLVGVRVRVNSKSGWTFSQLCATHTVCVCVYVHVCVCLCVCVCTVCPEGHCLIPQYANTNQMRVEIGCPFGVRSCAAGPCINVRLTVHCKAWYFSGNEGSGSIQGSPLSNARMRTQVACASSHTKKRTVCNQALSAHRPAPPRTRNCAHSSG